MAQIMGTFLAQALADAQAAQARVPDYTSGTRLEENRREIVDLEQRLGRLTLICLALWSLVQEKTDLKEEDLLERDSRWPRHPPDCQVFAVRAGNEPAAPEMHLLWPPTTGHQRL